MAEGQQGPHHLVEYPNNLQQIHEAQAQQEFMRHHHQLQQQEEQGFRELIAQNPGLLHQYQSSHNEAVMASLQNELFQQQRNRLVHDQLQQELQRQMSQDSHQRENAELFAMLQQQRGGDGQHQEPSSHELAELMRQHPQPSRTPTELHQRINQAAPSSVPTSFNPLEDETFRSRAGQTATPNSSDVGDRSEKQDPARLFSIQQLHNQRHNGDHAEFATRAYYDEHNGAHHAVQPQLERPASARGAMSPSSSSTNKTPPKVSAKTKDAKVKSNGNGKSKKKSDVTKKPKKKRKVEDEESPRDAKKKKTAAAKAKRNGKRDTPEKSSDRSRNRVDRSETEPPMEVKATSRETPVVANASSTEDCARNDDEAVSIVSNLRGVVVTENELEKVAEWSNEDLSGCKETLQGDLPDLGPFYSFHLPLLPVEPEDPGGASAKDPVVFQKLPPMRDGFAMNTRGDGSWTPKKGVAGQRTIRAPSENVKQDIWWPSKEDIAEERRRLGLAEVSTEQGPTDGRLTFERTGLKEAKQRLSTSKEPGVIEKLPHCVLYEKHFKKEKGARFQPKFCCQTTEAFPFEPMVCCSVCSTWRHAQCGGNYKRFTARSVDKSNPIFHPVCDRCVLEKRILAEGGSKQAEERLEKQRIKHLRRTNASNAVMRQAAFNKHSGQYKWPLGCVTVSHVAGHTRSVQSRHEKAERQWLDMVKKLSGEYKKDGMKPKEKLKIRTREFEKLLNHIEDAGKPRVQFFDSIST